MRRAAATLACVAIAALAFGAATGSAGKGKKVYWIDLSGQASQAPEAVFFTANAGGRVDDILWKNWGERKTVGRGDYSSTAPCPPDCNEEGPAKLVLRKPVRCTPQFGNKKGKKIRVYRRGTLTYPDPDGGEQKESLNGRTGWAVCKES
jgi:hypothetical protein